MAGLTVDQVSYLMQGIQYANIESDEDLKHTAIILQNRKKNASISEEDRGKIDAMWERVEMGASVEGGIEIL